jgi:hypothetical protein
VTVGVLVVLLISGEREHDSATAAPDVGQLFPQELGPDDPEGAVENRPEALVRQSRHPEGYSAAEADGRKGGSSRGNGNVAGLGRCGIVWSGSELVGVAGSEGQGESGHQERSEPGCPAGKLEQVGHTGILCS